MNFNHADLSGPDALHYPPIVRNGTAIVYAGYFPQFMIKTALQGENILLRGELKDRGKKAELTTGSKTVVIAGKTRSLAEAPVVIDGRLYLPAELLQEINGIPTRWEPRTKLLWVDTRFIRWD